MQPRWWQSSCVYQIYPRSFCDSNGDGIGDLPGITSKLDHLAALGVEVVWLSPVYASPNDDNGYDISDYRAIMAEFGTMADFDRMLDAMHARGLKLMMDLVVNHTSDEHAWFQEARSSRDNPYHDYYIWREPHEGREPNNWQAAFGGPAWHWNEATGEYYLHLFSPKQPDLNWENPKVRAEVHALMRFWLDKGVDGFRMDVINLISKRYMADGRLPDAPVVREGFLQPALPAVAHGPRLVEFLREMRRDVLDHYTLVTVGEAPGALPHHGVELTDPQDGALDMLFQFDHVDLDGGGPGPLSGKWAVRPRAPAELMASMSAWQGALAERGWNSLYLGNHDQPRPVSRFGDAGRWRVRSARALHTFLHGLRGTPYVYQGEEIGLTNVPFASIDELRDIESINMFREAVAAGIAPETAMAAIRAKSRDNARVPIPWDDSPDGGFSTGTPWIGLHPQRAEINVRRAVDDPDSVFHHLRRLIALRKRSSALSLGRFVGLPSDDAQVLAWLRLHGEQQLLVVCHLGDGERAWGLPHEWRFNRAELLIGTDPDTPDQDPRALRLGPWDARIIRLEGGAHA